MTGSDAPSGVDAKLTEFLDWARGRGYRYVMAPTHLRHLQSFLVQRGVERLGEVDSTLLADYQRHLLRGRSPTTALGYLVTLRALWSYLAKEDGVSWGALAGLTSLRPDHFEPHIYSERELEVLERDLQRACGRGRDVRQRFARQVQAAAFGLIRDCGLRVSEACHLDVGHFDSRRRSLLIERTKFFKTRRIPLAASTVRSLRSYLGERRKALGATAPDSPLFASWKGERLHRVTFECHFKDRLLELGLYRPRKKRGRSVSGSTNLHALRHTFAVHTLERWQRQHCDVERLLPLLSAYMGHCHVSYTKHYLHWTPALRQLTSERFEQHCLRQLDALDVLADSDERQESPEEEL
jgi:site-specific recombinase XerD